MKIFNFDDFNNFNLKNIIINNFKFKKSQSDMLGVVIIVAFLIFVIIFVVVLNINQQNDTLGAEYRMNSLTSNFLTTAFRTTACNSYSLSELVADCSKTVRTITCSGDFCNGDSCLCSRKMLKYLFNKTLDEWNENYYFNITEVDADLYISNGDCENVTIGATPSTLPIPVFGSGSKTLYAVLTICK